MSRTIHVNLYTSTTGPIDFNLIGTITVTAEVLATLSKACNVEADALNGLRLYDEYHAVIDMPPEA